MKFSQAMGFLTLGAAMLALPQVAPSLCPRNGFDGTSGRELWLYLMGCLQSGLGIVVLTRSAIFSTINTIRSLPGTMADIWDHVPTGVDGNLTKLDEALPRNGKVVTVDFAAKPVFQQSRAA